ncbi:MAG: AMP-binding protein [Actinomycetes bacterium]
MAETTGYGVPPAPDGPGRPTEDRSGRQRGNLADLVREAAARVPDRLALVDGERRVPWSALDADVDAFAAGVGRRGVQTGARVLLVCENTVEFVVAYFGCLRAGAVAVPVNTTYTPEEIRRVAQDADASAVVVQGGALESVRAACADDEDVRVVVAGTEPTDGEVAFDDVLAEGRAATSGRVSPDSGGEDLAVMIYTAGTTGRPKGAMLSHRALLANLDQCLALDPPPVSPDDVVLVALPLFHIYGLNGALGMVARTGATAVLVERFEPAETLALVRTAGVTNVPAAPPMYVAWASRPDLADALSGVRRLICGAAPLPATVRDRVRDAVGQPVYEGYGLTETSPVVSTTLASSRVKPGSVGRSVPGVEVRLVDEDGEDVEPGDPGEVWVRGASLFSGYWPDGSGGPATEGWYATGDLAYADEDGDLFLVGRHKELVLVSGFNVYPREVEDVLTGHPDVAEAAVVPVPHERTGEAVKAYVVPRTGARVTEDGLRDHYGPRLARFKWPTVVEVVDALPHSLSGKVVKRLLRPAQPDAGGGA